MDNRCATTNWRRCLTGAAAGGLLLGICSAAAADGLTAFTGVNVIPMTGETLLGGYTVIIEGDRIIAVGPTDAIAVPSGTKVVPTDGKYLVPGLMDMHVHLGLQRGPRDIDPEIREQAVEDELFLYIANGVTTVRNMMGSSYHLRMRERIAQGELLGPRMYTAGPLVDGVPPTWPSGHRILVDGVDVHAFIRDYLDEGYDFVKSYSKLSDNVYRALLVEARNMGVTVAGHIPTHSTVVHALEYGQASIEHMNGFDRVMQPADADALPPYPYSGWPTIDHGLMDEWAARTAAAGVWVCPTLVTLHNLGQEYGEEPGLAAVLSSPGMEFVSPIRMAAWGASPLYMSQAADFRAMIRAGQANRMRMVNALHRAGVPIIIGTDATAAYVVPGYAVATEFENLVAAGLSRYDALAAATSEAARFLRRENELGVVRPGALADLLLLDENPLEQAEALRSVAGVMVRGEWFSRAAIDARLREIRERQASVEVPEPSDPPAFRSPFSHVH